MELLDKNNKPNTESTQKTSKIPRVGIFLCGSFADGICPSTDARVNCLAIERYVRCNTDVCNYCDVSEGIIDVDSSLPFKVDPLRSSQSGTVDAAFHLGLLIGALGALVIVAEDAGTAVLAEATRESGTIVFVIGSFASTPQELIAAADHYIPLETIPGAILVDYSIWS